MNFKNNYKIEKFGPVHERRDYSKTMANLPTEDLIKFQKNSYEWLFEKGLEESFKHIFPIISTKKNLKIEFLSLEKREKEREEFSKIKTCRKKGTTYSTKIRAELRLEDIINGETTTKSINFGEIPAITNSGTFIINGIEKVVISQLLRSPGSYFGIDVRAKSGDDLWNKLEIIPRLGIWIDIHHVTKKGKKVQTASKNRKQKKSYIKISLDKHNAIPLSTFLMALGLQNETMIEYFGDRELISETINYNKFKDSEKATKHIHSILRKGDRITADSINRLFYNFIFNKRRYNLTKTGRFMLKRKLALSTRIIGTFLSQDIKDENNVVVFPANGKPIDKNTAFAIDNYFKKNPSAMEIIKDIDFDKLYHLNDVINLEQRKEEIEILKQRNKICVLDVYSNQKDFEDKTNIIKVIGHDPNANEEHLLVSDILASISYYMNVLDGIAREDDHDSLINKRVISIGEILQNQFQIALLKLEKNAKEKMSLKDASDDPKIIINKIINSKIVQNQFKTFFNSSQLCQFMDQVNPLAEISNKRRITSLGPGGLSKDTANFEVRDIHSTHFGRICPVETPEGPNIGLILNLANYAVVDEYGFIKTPYYKVKKGIVQFDKGPIYLTAYEEIDQVFAEATTVLDKNNAIIKEEIVSRKNSEYIMASPKEINYITVSSKQMGSITTSCVPFLENNDANRALMAANMQRQAVPLIKAETPLVGTGMECEIAKSSSFNLKSEKDGTITYVDGNMIKISNKNKLYTYNLKTFVRTNQGTLFTQKPIVKIGQEIKKGDIIADGSSFDKGELALGKNVLVAFSTWRGYNYEDAIILSERLYKEDVFTSIHIEEQTLQFRKSKMGEDELTRDIPNVSNYLKRNLDINGIIKVGSEVKIGDVLVGRASPRGEENSVKAQDQLMNQILGKKMNPKKDTSLKVKNGHDGTVIDVKILSRTRGDKLPDGVEMIVKILIAQKRKIKVGDKMAGRHGNKGVISRVLPIEDMPHLEDGTPVDIMLNPQGIPSRMNIGQVLEMHLGYAARKLNTKFITPIFDGIKYEEIKNIMSEAQIAEGAKYDLYDPILGQKFDNKVSIGIMYMLKLNHMVDDKMHARSVGPYSLITQQPLGGKSQNGGQRFGEMEVWAIEAYGAANLLQEMLTYKSDDINGRNKLYKAIVTNTKLPLPSIPESFKVLAYELKGLGLKIAFNNNKDELKLENDDKVRDNDWNIEEKIKSVFISIATSKDIQKWSKGEVKLPETINYKTFKPVPKGLFDEIIFGPTHDFKCSICNKKYKSTNSGQKCEATQKCSIANSVILPKITRRERMGHIQLAKPIVHYWFYKIDNSIISKIFGLGRSEIKEIINFKSHIVVEEDKLLKSQLPLFKIIELNTAPSIYRDALKTIIAKQVKDRDKTIKEHNETEYNDRIEELNEILEEHLDYVDSAIGKDYGVDFYELNSSIEAYSKVRILTGPDAIKYLLKHFNVNKEILKIKKEINSINKMLGTSKSLDSKKQTRTKLYKRLQVLNAFKTSKQDLTNLLIEYLPIIPADLRPLIQIDGGRHSTVDINELYRRIIIRNNRLKKWIEQEAPQLIIQNEWRMLQEAVASLIDNERREQPVLAKDNRPLKSLASSLVGKKGRFRQNLLGKRVDYSGRSVIVVSSELKMHQAGIPRKMAAKLFEPWIINLLIKSDEVQSQKGAKKLIDSLDPRIWPYVEKVVNKRVILLNRAPSLHRLSIQAFEPVLVRGEAIKLHPLVTTAFNADFDGDQMAVHVPISDDAIREARELMLANKNILNPKDGEPIINPTQDIVLGLYYLTKEKRGLKGEKRYFNDYKSALRAYNEGYLDLHALIVIKINKHSKLFNKPNINKEGYITTTIGKLIFNNIFPSSFPFIFDDTKTTLLNKHYRKYFAETLVGNQEKGVVGILDKIDNEKNLTLSLPLSKKKISIICRKVFDDYVHVFHQSELASLINKKDFLDDLRLDQSSMLKTSIIEKLKKIKMFDSEKTLNLAHCNIIGKSLRAHLVKKFGSNKNEAVKYHNADKVELFNKTWFDYSNKVASILDGVKDLGFKFSMISGTTMSIEDIIVVDNKAKMLQEGDQFVTAMKKSYEAGLLTNDERYEKVISKWSNIKKAMEKNLEKKLKEEIDNPIFTMINSGARGSISNYVQLAGMRGNMANNKKMKKALSLNEVIVKSTIEIPVKTSFLEGLSSYEFYSSTHGARKGLTDTALNTANTGYLTRRLVDVAQNITVREEDCGTDDGSSIKAIVNSKTKEIIVPLEERIEGRFTNITHYDKDTGEIVVKRNELITNEVIKRIKDAKLKSIYCRTVIGCRTKYGVCQKCFGKDLATNRLVSLHEPVGVVAAQSIGEPGTQLTMRTFHTGGVAGVSDITGGFYRLRQLIDAVKSPWQEKAEISSLKGEVIHIKDSEDKERYPNMKEILIQYPNKDKETTTEKIYFSPNRWCMVKKGEKVRRGQILVDGPIVLEELLEVAGPKKVQNYLIKEIQTLYRMQGIVISDKHIEIIVKQMLSKIIIQDSGASNLFVGSIVDIYTYKEEVKKQISKGKKPPFGKMIIKGIGQISLLSKSWLSASSYLRTAEVLVHASIAAKEDKLIGLKENVILGHKIPCGTFKNKSDKGKFDIKDPKTYFDLEVAERFE